MNHAGKTIGREVAPGRGYTVGQLISQIFHPVLVSIVTLFLVGIYATAPLRGLGWALLCTAIQVIPNAGFFTWRMRQGAYSDNDVSVRQQRTELYIVGIISMIVGIGILSTLGAPTAFIAASVAGLLLTVICALVNMYWKISVHSATMASAATILSLFSTYLGVLLWVCAVSVGWARIRTGNHTPLQVLAGFAVAALSVLLTFQMLPAL
jgi:membrane-associated phospholipid phosphatase